MRPIRQEDISKLNDIIMELPAFANLQSKNNIHEVLDIFLEDIYRTQPKEIFDMFQFELSERMQDTFFLNYGIDKKYSSKLKGYLKRDIAFQLEKLYQGKGSKDVFRIFADIFENVFRRINFYNVKVFKIPLPTGGFRLEYRLVPLYITDPENVIEYPQIPVEQTRKYLMELENYRDYKVWPVPTNLVYIQFSIGEEVINNMDTFLDGVRSFGTTYNQDKYLDYTNRNGYIEKILASDLELIITYFKTEITKAASPDWDFDIPIRMASYLPYDNNLTGDPNYPSHAQWTQDRITFMQSMQTLMTDYKNADRRNRAEMESIKRRWQMFMKLKEKDDSLYPNYQSIVDEIELKYPMLKDDFLFNLNKTIIDSQDNEPLFDFYVYTYSVFLSGVFSNPEDPSYGLDQTIVIDYVDVLFGTLFVEADFLKWYFNPVMDLFIRYFFPIEMEYINDLTQKVFIKDKWNVISYDDTQLRFEVKAGEMTPFAYRWGLDHWRFDLTVPRHSHIDPKSMHGSDISHPVIDKNQAGDDFLVTLYPRLIKDSIRVKDSMDTKICTPPIGTLIDRSFCTP